MNYPSIRGEALPDHAKNPTWKLLHACMDEHSQRLIEDYTVYVLQATTILQSQCANMNFSDQIRYNRLFQQVIHKGGESAINYIKIFQNAKALEISLGHS